MNNWADSEFGNGPKHKAERVFFVWLKLRVFNVGLSWHSGSRKGIIKEESWQAWAWAPVV